MTLASGRRIDLASPPGREARAVCATGRDRRRSPQETRAQLGTFGDVCGLSSRRLSTVVNLAFAGIPPNPARDKVQVCLPRESKPEIVPPTAEHVQAVHDLLPTRYRLPLLVLDATGIRLGELEGLTRPSARPARAVG